MLYLLKNQKRDEWIKTRQALRDAANQARSEAAKEQPRAVKLDGKSGFSGPLSHDSAPEPKPDTRENRAYTATATAAKVSPATAARAESLVNARGEGTTILKSGE